MTIECKVMKAWSFENALSGCQNEWITAACRDRDQRSGDRARERSVGLQGVVDGGGGGVKMPITITTTITNGWSFENVISGYQNELLTAACRDRDQRSGDRARERSVGLQGVVDGGGGVVEKPIITITTTITNGWSFENGISGCQNEWIAAACRDRDQRSGDRARERNVGSRGVVDGGGSVVKKPITITTTITSGWSFENIVPRNQTELLTAACRDRDQRSGDRARDRNVGSRSVVDGDGGGVEKPITITTTITNGWFFENIVPNNQTEWLTAACRDRDQRSGDRARDRNVGSRIVVDGGGGGVKKPITIMNAWSFKNALSGYHEGLSP